MPIVSARDCAHVLLGILFIAFQVQWSIAGVLITPCLKFNSLTGLEDPMAGERPARVTAKDVDSRRATAAKGNACSSNRATRAEVRMEVKEECVFDGRHQALQMTNPRVLSFLMLALNIYFYLMHVWGTSCFGRQPLVPVL
jgi:hypothetical protein